jgi:hypothetical protein
MRKKCLLGTSGAALLFVLLALTFGMVLAGCDPGTGGDNEENDAKVLRITGINLSGAVTVMLTTEVNNQSAAVLVRNDDNSGTGVYGTATISNGSVSMPLKIIQFVTNGKPSFSEDDWTGSGQYFIWLWNADTYSGSPPYSAPVSDSWTEKISFSSKTTTVPWNKFVVSPE